MQRTYTRRLGGAKAKSSIYVDEEECLTAQVFANELELLVGDAKLHHGR